MILWNSCSFKKHLSLSWNDDLLLDPEMKPTQKLHLVRHPLFQGMTLSLQHGFHAALPCPQSLQGSAPQF